MIRTLIAAALALLATPAIADTIPIVDGPLTVHNGDILVTSKPLVGKVVSGAISQSAGSNWINRMDGKPFTLSGGATRLGIITAPAVGYALNGFTYQVMDGIPAVVTPPVVVQPVVPPAPPSPAGPLYGINLSGGEFANQDGGAFLPTPANLDAYYAVGYRAARIPIKFAQFTNGALPKLTALANECIKLGMPCVFENHSYLQPSVADGISQVVTADRLLPKSPFIQWGLANEPSLKDFDQAAVQDQAIITGYRAAGATIRVWIDYPGSSGAQRFDKGKRTPYACDSFACALVKLPTGTLVDPLHATGIDIHRYFDSNGSGSSATCDKYTMLLSAAQQAVPFGLPIMFGEYAFGNDVKVSPTCALIQDAIMAEIKASPNLSFAMLWGGGYRWKDGYMFRALPKADSPYIQMTTGK